MTDRTLTEREAFRAVRYFIEQFNEREKSPVLALWLNWMDDGSAHTPPQETWDPAQWSDWTACVDRVLSERHE